MGIITDILKALPLTAVQQEVIREQEKRLETLESENLSLKTRLALYESGTSEKCPACRKPTFNLVSNKPNSIFGQTGLNDYCFTCSVCGF